MKIDLFTNQYILYFIIFLSVINILGYLMNKNYGAVIFFLLVLFVSFYFTKNLTIVLGVSLILTNFLGSLAEIFNVKSTNLANNKEGFQVESETNEPKNSSVNISEKETFDVEGISLNNNNNELQKSFFSEMIQEGGDSNNKKYKKMKELEKQSDFLNSQMNIGNFSEIQEKTQNLLKEQDGLMKQLSDFGPLLSKSLKAMSNINSDNIGSVVNDLTGNLDTLYAKYPSAFPSDYKSKSHSLRKSVDLLNKEKLRNAELDESFKELAFGGNNESKNLNNQPNENIS